jgi:retron-type reverse transcriptase
MNNGNVNNNNKTNNNYVWPVRGDNDALRLFSFENIYRQYLKCRKNKRNTVNALKFEMNCEENLIDLKQELDTGSYYPSRSVCFMAVKPKLREIFAADFKDRIVHHILVDYLEKLFEPKFIHDSYACRKGKGIHTGTTRLRRFVGKATKNGSRKAFYLQLDIKNFFMSIDKDVLYDLIVAKVKDEKRQSLQPVSNGINFLGYIVRHNYVLVRRRVVNNLKARLEGFENKLIMKDGCSYT